VLILFNRNKQTFVRTLSSTFLSNYFFSSQVNQAKMSKKCPGCNKTVYFAERQVKDGVDWHGSCLIRFVQDQKKGAQASNPFQSYRGAPSPVAPRKDNSRPSSLDIVPTPEPTIPATTAATLLTNSSSPPPVRAESPEPAIPSYTPEPTPTPAPTPTPTPTPAPTPTPTPTYIAPVSAILSPTSPVLRTEERRNSNSKLEEFLLQNSTPSAGPSSLGISVDTEPVSEPAAEGEGEEEAGGGTGFCSNCGEARGTDGAKFCSNCGEEFI